MKVRYNPKIADDAQYIYCRERGYLRCAPYRGFCKNCKQNIYELIDRNGEKTGISVLEAASRHIILCPHCGFDFYAQKKQQTQREHTMNRKDTKSGRNEQF